MGKEIWIFAEHDGNGTKKITLELLSEGKRLARRLDEPLCVCLLGVEVEGLIPVLSQHGAEKIYLAEHSLLSHYNIDPYSQVLGDLIKEHSPSILIMGATPKGSEIAPRIAARLRLPCITGVQKITGSRGNLQITKALYNNQAHATITPLSERTMIITIPPGESDVVIDDERVEPEIVRKEVTLTADMVRTKYRTFKKGDPRTIGIDEADIIVAVGRGAGGEGLPLLQELADIIGASIGGSRAAVDEGIIPYERQIGISGSTVSPNCLIACGISGAREFTTGMETSRFVIAVNKDPKARIFDYSDLPIRGDLHAVVPSLIKALKNKENSKP